MSWSEFPEVTLTVPRKIRCFGCSKRLSRQRTFRRPLRDGFTRQQLRLELLEEAARWYPQGVCASCMQSGKFVMLEDGNFALKFPGSAEPAPVA